MKTKLTLLLLTLSLAGFSQSRVGLPIYKVRAEFSDSSYMLRYMRHDTAAFLVLQDKYAVVIHRFGADSICNKTYVTPNDTTVAYEMARTYNAIYKPLAPAEWVVNISNELMDVEMVEITGKPAFQWSKFKKQQP